MRLGVQLCAMRYEAYTLLAKRRLVQPRYYSNDKVFACSLIISARNHDTVTGYCAFVKASLVGCEARGEMDGVLKWAILYFEEHPKPRGQYESVGTVR